MSLFEKIKNKTFNEFIDIIEWTDSTSNTIIWCFPCYQAEIKNGAQLTVRERQVAVLVNEGKFADVYQPGRYELTTNNMPILSTLKGWKYGFNSSFKVDVYFINTKQFLNLRWGTANPIMMRDPEFGPIRMRAFGSYCFRVKSDPREFIRNVVGKNGDFTTESILGQLRNFVIAKFTAYLRESKVAALDLAANLNEFSTELTIALKNDFSEYGIELTNFLIENISLPEAVEEEFNKRISMGVIGNLAGDAMGKADIGLAMAGKITNIQRTAQTSSHETSMPPPIPQQTMYHIAINGTQQGPYSTTQLQQMVLAGQLTTETLVWKAGMSSWAAAGTVSELSQLFGAVPPPL